MTGAGVGGCWLPRGPSAAVQPGLFRPLGRECRPGLVGVPWRGAHLPVSGCAVNGPGVIDLFPESFGGDTLDRMLVCQDSDV